MKKAIMAAVVVVAVVAVVFLVRSKKQDAGTYRFALVEKGTVESVVSSTGTLRATSTVQVGTQVSGKLDAIYADFNDHVTEGQLIARIDPTLLEQEVRSARTSVERSQADLDQATREMERAERLYAGKVITDREYTTAQYQLALAKTSFEASQINLDKAQRNLKYTEIRAPVDGTILERNVDVGQTVAASLSAPQLFLIAGDLSEMEIVALVDESDIGLIQPDQPVRFTVQAFPDRPFLGTVRQVRLQSTTQENVVNYLVAISVANDDGRLLPGMTATVEFIIQRAEDVLKVSNAALRFQPTAAMREEMQARRAEAGPGGAAGDSTRQAPGRIGGGDRSRGGTGITREGGTGRGGSGGRGDRGLLWTVDTGGKLDVVPVKVGISDGQFTQITGPKLTEGMQVIAAVATSAAGGPANPFENNANQSGSRRPRPGF